MNKEEKEQWLYETYNYTSNFDFSRLDKYEEANDDICIDTLILDYTMLYEFHKEEIKIKNKVVNDLLKRISNLEFDVEDKQREIERLNNIVNQVEKLAESEYEKYKDKSDVSLNCVALANLKILNKIKELKGSDSNE